MKITAIEVKNFRILEDIKIALDEKVTLVVGRNNSGKTSLTEVLYKFFGTSNNEFYFEDFSITTYENIKKALDKYAQYTKAKSDGENEDVILKLENEYKDLIPKIILNIYIEYEDADSLASLSKFIMDLDQNRKDALISCEYVINSPEKMFDDYLVRQDKYENNIVSFLKKNHKKYYKEKIFAVDSLNKDNFREIESKAEVDNIFLSRFIYAQNKLDDQSIDKSKGLSKSFEDYYRFNNGDNSEIEKIEDALLKISADLDDKYKSLFSGIFSDLKGFGINEGINLQELEIKSFFDAEKILRGNTQLFYDHDDNLLPEAHNGLGYSKLIFTILRFISFYEEYDKRNPRPNFQLLFVEEPEAHLHPQMQHVFIKNIREFILSKKNWDVQVVITTHSSHVVAESGFENIRYFDISQRPIKVRDLSEFEYKQEKSNGSSLKFLKQYLSLHRCDMFFADKIIMIEGTVERLLLPEIIKRDCKTLNSQYVSIIEVGGAYACIFKDLLEFINVKTLVITDIDSVKKVGTSWKKCPTSEGEKTSNITLKEWLPKKEKVADLLKATANEKIENNVRVSYQIPEIGSSICGRSFEESFILKNAKNLNKTTENISTKHLFQVSESDIKSNSYDIASKIEKKTDFAFDIMMLEKWDTPEYIKEGLLWLEK